MPCWSDPADDQFGEPRVSLRENEWTCLEQADRAFAIRTRTACLSSTTVVMLALGFLLMIGMTLVAEGFGSHGMKIRLSMPRTTSMTTSVASATHAGIACQCNEIIHEI
jgi:hypothetical protein